jgi:hypothetical protein
MSTASAQSDPSLSTIACRHRRRAGDELLGRTPDGLRTYKGMLRLTPLSTNTTFTDQAGWKAPQYYTTIHTAKLMGGQAAQVSTRSRRDLRVHLREQCLEPVEHHDVALEDDPWAASASYMAASRLVTSTATAAPI